MSIRHISPRDMLPCSHCICGIIFLQLALAAQGLVVDKVAFFLTDNNKKSERLLWTLLIIDVSSAAVHIAVLLARDSSGDVVPARAWSASVQHGGQRLFLVISDPGYAEIFQYILELLIFFAAMTDFTHGIIKAQLRAAALMEDGGEMMVMTYIAF